VRLAVACVAAILALAAGAASAQTQQEMNAQAGGELRKAEARMDAIYAKVLGKISNAGKENLQTAQEAWLRFRDQECEFETMGTKGGSIHPMVVAECRRRLTNQRIKDLEDQANCQEGNVSCGNQ
jgi:uncharacterized protein YecT (DUF1311 family)